MAGRKINRIWPSQPTREGAGVHLRRAFGFHGAQDFDPFLLLDDFRADRPEEFIAGFPWHPHRGIETITCMLEGSVEHEDSIGNQGVIGPGDVQWMTAGGGILHQEMPKPGPEGKMGGFQLWANLPATRKMMAPRYQEFTADQLPVAPLEGGGTAIVICGEIEGIKGPVQNVLIDPGLFNISLPAGAHFEHALPAGYTAIAYVFEGQVQFGDPGDGDAAEHGNHTVALFDRSEDADRPVLVQTREKAARLLLMTGKPLGEPIAWRGPIVMNSQQELQLAFREIDEGTFLRSELE